jgi:ABC-2 type transport system ATP-binding protein
MSDAVIEVSNLTKRFGKFTAVDDISFSVSKGEIFAFLGPNGAGKSTTIKMLITLLSPTSGGGRIGNLDFVRQQGDVRRIIGYVPQMVSVDGTLTASENLMLMAKLYDIPHAVRKEKVKEILAFLNLEDHADSLVRILSGGMIRKLEIGQAFLHQPEVLFLDEPTTGLDPVAKKNVWDRLLELNKKFGTTIFFSTHNMEEAEEVATRVAIMNAGKIAAIDTVAGLKKKTGKKNAALSDVFIFFTGNLLQEKGDFRNIRETRQAEYRRG